MDNASRVVDVLADEDTNMPRRGCSPTMALRYWIGRSAGNDKKLYDLLTKKKDYTEPEAGDIMQMLHWLQPRATLPSRRPGMP